VAAAASCGGHAADLISPFLADPAAVVRRAAIRALGRTRDPRALDALIETAGRGGFSSEWRERAQLASSLGRFGGGRAEAVLIKLLDDPYHTVRVEALRALARTGCKAAVARGRSLLDAREPDVAAAAADLLGAARDVASRDRLAALTSSGDARVRSAAQAALRKLSDQ
jgi:HEAT repeat protein